MIRLSTKGRYGTRLMLNLAHNYNNGINKLVKSIRGAGGGYILARHPSQIKLSDILNSLEGTMSLVECVEDDDYCDRTDVCATHEIWKEASSMLQNYFESLTLQDLAAHENKKKKSRKK
jgi:DNA-binding IscR family transcriptional regulator